MTFIKTALTLILSVWVTALSASHEIAISPEQMEWLGINLARVEPATWITTDRLPASVVIPPPQERVVSTPSAGLVTGLRVGTGEEVNTGDVMALIESPALVALQREYLQALTEQALANAEIKRDRKLYGEGIIAQRRFLATRGHHEQAKATLEERRQALKHAGMDEAAISALGQSRRLTSMVEVKAPGNGIVLESMTVVGQRLEHADPLYRLARLEPLWLEISVPLDRLAGVKIGASVELPCPTGQSQVTRIGRNVDPDTQTVLVRAEVREAKGCLRPGQFVQVRLRLAGSDSRFRVPSSAVVRSGKECLIFVRAPFGFLAMPVEIVTQKEGHAIVTGQLQGDETVAVSGLAAIKGAWMGLGGTE